MNEEYEYSYYDIPKAQFSTSTSSKSSNYLDHYNRDYFYAHHNLTGYPQFGQYANDVEYDYDDYNNNNYEYIEEPSSNNADNLVAPHPVMVALQKWINGIQTRQDINGFLVQLFPGNTIVSLSYRQRHVVYRTSTNSNRPIIKTASELSNTSRNLIHESMTTYHKSPFVKILIELPLVLLETNFFKFQYLVFSVVLGIIGVGGLVFQWAQSIIDQWYKDIEDLQTRVTSLESRSTTVSVPQSVLTSISTLQTDLTSLTTKHANTCARVSITFAH